MNKIPSKIRNLIASMTVYCLIAIGYAVVLILTPFWITCSILYFLLTPESTVKEAWEVFVGLMKVEWIY